VLRTPSGLWYSIIITLFIVVSSHHATRIPICPDQPGQPLLKR
jgi:hypothetical protein